MCSRRRVRTANWPSATFTPGKLVVAALRFQTHESNGAFYQDIVASEIHGMQTA